MHAEGTNVRGLKMSPRRKSRGNATRTSSRINGPLYKSLDTILCNFNGQLYDATILDVKRVDALEEEKKQDDNPDPISIRSMSSNNGANCVDKFAYYLHYKKWNSTWDEWVRSDCLMPITEDSRKKQQELKLAVRKEKIKKTSKRKRRRYTRHTTMSESKSTSVSQEATQDDDNLPKKIELVVATTSTDKLDDDKGLVADDEHEEPIVEIVDAENQTDVSSENQVSKSTPYLLVQYENESSPSESVDNQEESAGTDFMIDKHGESDTDAFEHLASDVSVDAKGLQTDDTHDEPMGESVNPENRTDFTSENQGSTPTPPPLSLVQYENDSSSSSPPEILEINDDSRTDELEEPNSISSKTIMEHPCSVIGNPTINDILPELQHYLSSFTSIGDVKGSAFIEKLRMMFEEFCAKFIKPDARKDAEQRMRETNDSLFGSVVHYSGLYKLIVDLESGDWKKLEFYNPPTHTSCDQEDLQIIFRLCKDYFDATKRFLQFKSGCSPCTLQETDASITQDQEQTV